MSMRPLLGRTGRLVQFAAFAGCLVFLGGCADMAARDSIHTLKNPPITYIVVDTIAEPSQPPTIVPHDDPASLIPEGAPPQLRAEGNRLVGPDGTAVRLRGVNIASLEWQDEGENVLESMAVAIDDWGSNVIRVPLSQDRWFGRSPTQSDGGARYREIVDAMVVGTAQRGAYIILELHWNNAGVWGENIGQHHMPDEGSKLFWQDLGQRYGNHPAVLMGLYNEPHRESWDTWLNGGVVEEDVRTRRERDPENPIPRVRTRIRYRAVGLQELYDATRAAGATDSIIVIGALDWAYDLSGILTGHAVEGENILYDSHVYGNKDWKPEFSWENTFLTPSQTVPVLIGEWGGGLRGRDGEEDDFIPRMVKVLRENEQLHWTAWCFHPQAGPPLLRNWDYEPNETGQIIIDELKATN
ncbi:MAG: cellulase family glycosylhydrolase [Candidatus Brocadiae bacterium]|nr:cellulase family glycosylhydrolase [Candidatus Brocadiia bacterium]